MRKFISILAAAFAVLSFVSCSNGGENTVHIPSRPEFLQPGDTVGIMTISSPVTDRPGESDTLINIVKSWGVNVKLGKNVFKLDARPFSVTDKERAEEFMGMVRDTNIKAIVFYRGGYGAIRTLEYLDFEEIKRNPKWIVGFSDVTTLHLALQGAGMESIHGPMLSSYWMTRRPDSAAISVGDALFGRVDSYHIKPHPYNRLGSATGKIVGGNMTLISIAEGTPYDLPVDDNTIIMIEEIGENMNAIDGMMQQLKKSGKLAKAKALLVGNFTNIDDKEDPWEVTPEDVIKQYADELDVPVVFGFPAGHGRPNLAIFMGRDVDLSVREDGVDISFK
jgi:muramoyltetrapeptide carboxypeptidase